MRISTKFSYQDLQHIPPDRNRYEIVEGGLFVTPAPKTLHQRIVANLLVALHQHVREHQLGEVFVAPVDVVFTSSTVLEPDVLFVSRPRLHIVGEKNLSGPPDLAVEFCRNPRLSSTARSSRSNMPFMRCQNFG